MFYSFLYISQKSKVICGYPSQTAKTQNIFNFQPRESRKKRRTPYRMCIERRTFIHPTAHISLSPLYNDINIAIAKKTKHIYTQRARLYVPTYIYTRVHICMRRAALYH